MKRYTVKFHVDAPPERVFAYLVDPKGIWRRTRTCGWSW
jgi:uncharacterized protein YndB with AHSA1/START domain